MLDHLSEREFNIWLAGFFDGEGCVYFPKPGYGGMRVTLANTIKSVIFGIFDRIKLGTIEICKYDLKKWKDKNLLILNRYSDCHKFLKRIQPFLTLKKEKADFGIAKCEAYFKKVNERHKNIRRAIRLFEGGMRKADIARVIGTSDTNICGWIKRAKDPTLFNERAYDHRAPVYHCNLRAQRKHVVPKTKLTVVKSAHIKNYSRRKGR
jgi:hypothetical protein